MAYKLPYKGMSRIPSGKGFTINISEDDLKSKKSASPEPPKQISYEGQGGKDYENLPKDAINPEGQGGRDYEAKDYKPKKDGVSRKEAKYFGLGEDDGTARKNKKADKTAKQVIKMQNKRSSVKNVYLGDPDDLQGEMVRTADKPAGKREKRKVKKLKKTKDQLSPLNFGPEAIKLAKNNSGKKNAKASKIPRKSIGSVTTLKSEKKVDVKTDKKDIDSKLLTKTTPNKKEPQSRAEKRNIATKNKADRARKDASRTNKEGGTIETQAKARAKAKRLDKRAKRQEGRAERKAVKKDKSLSRSDKRGKIIASRENQNK